jgi:excinuclease UvrABC nuclease subunit
LCGEKMNVRDIQKKWSCFEEKKIEQVPDVFGVYELADRNKEIVYIGHGRLKERLRRHFTENIYKEVTYFRYEETFSKEKAKKREKALLSKFEKENKRLPKYNKRFG